MKHSTKLADLLQSTFALHRARVTCLAALVIALFRLKTVNLAGLATAFPGAADIDSHYRRLQRFFKHIRPQPARGHLRARFSTRRPLHPGSRSNPVTRSFAKDPLPLLRNMSVQFQPEEGEINRVLMKLGWGLVESREVV